MSVSLSLSVNVSSSRKKENIKGSKHIHAVYQSDSHLLECEEGVSGFTRKKCPSLLKHARINNININRNIFITMFFCLQNLHVLHFAQKNRLLYCYDSN
jgi:hypothetical protein